MNSRSSSFGIYHDTLSPDIFHPSSNDDGYVVYPPDEFVLCRKSSGDVTARYGDELWDLKPFRTTKGDASTYKFPATLHCVQQFKWIMFLNFYYRGSRSRSLLTTGNLTKRYRFLLTVSEFCFKSKVTLNEFFSDERTMMLYIKEQSGNRHNLKQFRTCLLYTSPSPRDRTRSRMPSSA